LLEELEPNAQKRQEILAGKLKALLGESSRMIDASNWRELLRLPHPFD